MASGSGTKVCFAHSEKLAHVAELNPRFMTRASMVQSLIEAYGLIEHLTIVCPEPASLRQLRDFHSKQYLACLQKVATGMADDEELEEFGLGYDCPPFANVFEYVSCIAGASLSLADCLMREEAQVAINWYGGWHHGKKDEAAGFCYCNDIVLSILKLLEKFQRVLYIDLDVHHGDGVEEAFYYSDRVLTLSVHKFSLGFFPGSGNIDSIGRGNGMFYSVNLPLQDGVTDHQYCKMFRSVAGEIHSRFSPEVVLVQCGADSLANDPLGSFNLTLQGVGECVESVLSWKLPTMLLGGGGYNFPNTARLWAYLTSLSLGACLSGDIPEHQYFQDYAPGYDLHQIPNNRIDCNSDQRNSELLSITFQNLQNVTAVQ